MNLASQFWGSKPQGIPGEFVEGSGLLRHGKAKVSEARMTQKKSARSLPQEELDNRRRQFARIEFLKQLDTACPDVRAGLLKVWKRLEPKIRAAISASQDQLNEQFDAIREEVLARYSTSDHGAVSVSGPTQNVWGWYRGVSQGVDPLRNQLESDIRDWARQHRIEADWMRDTAIENINRWFQDPTKEEQKVWLRPSVGMLRTLSPEDSEFRFRLPHAWEPTFDLPAAVRKRIETAFKVSLNDWMERTERLVKELGFEEVRERPELEKHIGWLIRHRVLDQGYTAIAREDGLVDPGNAGRVTVTAGIKSASKLIGFDPA